MNMSEWKVIKYGGISGPYFPEFGLNSGRYSVSLRIQPNAGKHGPELTPYMYHNNTYRKDIDG